MSISNCFHIFSIEKRQTYDWLLNKHYAKRIPSISFSFGLYDEKYILRGVTTFGKPASPNLCDGVCGKENSKYVYELNRLCINDGLPKNTLSYFVASSLKLLPPLIIVSYADVAQNHNGYIYQATNWIYTGKTKERTDIGSENGTHSRHYDRNIDYSKNRKLRSSKHRYISFTGSRKQKKYWRSCLKYKIYNYPKGENIKYDARYTPNTQELLKFAMD
tara:strand:+ start:45 stop:698 length:654 start_codon:yes stop_codon:yes gene_type:complete